VWAVRVLCSLRLNLDRIRRLVKPLPAVNASLNLGPEFVFPIAHALRERAGFGRVPTAVAGDLASLVLKPRVAFALKLGGARFAMASADTNTAKIANSLNIFSPLLHIGLYHNFWTM